MKFQIFLVLYVWEVSDFSMHQNHLEALLRHRLLDFTLRVSGSVSLDWCPESLHP